MGFCCGLGTLFFEEGIDDVDNIIIPKVEEKMKVSINHQATGTLLWFVQEVPILLCTCADLQILY